MWEGARLQGAILVTKDEDFLGLSVALGVPPKVVCLAIGNANNASTARLLLQQAKAIEQFCLNPEAGFLLLGSFLLWPLKDSAKELRAALPAG